MSETQIIVDSREQSPWFSSKESITKGLKTGDYSLAGFEEKFSLERKSLMDLYGTLGKGHSRFKKELERAKSLEYFAILVEGDYDEFRTKQFPKAYHTKMRGYVIASIMSTISIKYNIPIFFCSDPKNCRLLAKDLMKSYIKIKQNEVPSCHEVQNGD